MWNVDSRTLAISLSVGGLVAGTVYLWYQKQRTLVKEVDEGFLDEVRRVRYSVIMPAILLSDFKAFPLSYCQIKLGYNFNIILINLPNCLVKNGCF